MQRNGRFTFWWKSSHKHRTLLFQGGMGGTDKALQERIKKLEQQLGQLIRENQALEDKANDEPNEQEDDKAKYTAAKKKHDYLSNMP